MTTVRSALALLYLLVPAGIVCYWADRDGPPLEPGRRHHLLAASTVAGALEGRRVASGTKAHEPLLREGEQQRHHRDDHAEHGKRSEEHEKKGEEQEEQGENEEEHEKKVSPLMFTIAVLIGLFLFANVGLLYLVNFRDENVRSSIYKMISSTMSIFLAVTLNAAIFSFFLEQLLPSPPPRGFNIKVTPLVQFLVGLGIFVSASLAVNIIGCRWTRTEDEEKFFVLKTIGGHITAFAGITTFGTLQVEADAHDASWWHGHHYTVVVISGCVLVVLRFVAGRFRKAAMTPKSTDEVRYAQCIREEPAGERMTEWAEEMCESEDEAHSLILSFLLSRVAVWHVSGKILPLHDSEEPIRHPTHDILQLLSFLPVGLLVLFGVVLVRQYIKPCDWLGGKDPTMFYMRALNNVQTTSGVTMSWFACIVGFWLTQLLLHGTQLDSTEMAKVLNAFSLTLFAIIGIIIVDKIADRLAERKTKVSIHEKQHFKNLEKLLRTVIDSFALLVGLLWELASDASIETIIEGNVHLSQHRVLSKIGIAVLMFCFVFTAWLEYIVPPAKKSSDDHHADMLMEELQQTAGRGCDEQAETLVKAITLRVKHKLKLYPGLVGKVADRLQDLQREWNATKTPSAGSEQRSHSA